MKSLHRTLISGALALLLTAPFIAAAQWHKKPYTEWSEKEALKVLDDSPWGQTQVFTGSPLQYSGPNRELDGNRAIDVGGNRIGLARNPEIAFRIRFLSAKPIRQAVSRLVEINQKDRMNEPMAAQLRAFIGEDFSEYVVISVICNAPKPTVRLQDVKKLFGMLSTDILKENTYLLIDGTRRIPLAAYQPPHDDGLGARFLFPRLQDGKPLIPSTASEIRFHAQLSDQYTLSKNYKIRDMVYEGKVEY